MAIAHFLVRRDETCLPDSATGPPSCAGDLMYGLLGLKFINGPRLVSREVKCSGSVVDLMTGPMDEEVLCTATVVCPDRG